MIRERKARELNLAAHREESNSEKSDARKITTLHVLLNQFVILKRGKNVDKNEKEKNRLKNITNGGDWRKCCY